MEAKGYKKLRVLGKGGFGQAWLIQGKDGKHYVSKDVNLNNMPRAERSLAQNEVKVLRKLVHPNIIQYVDSFEDHGMLHIVMEYADSGDVGSFLKKQRSPLTEEQVLHYFVQICLALKHVHDLKILHRDLKPQNIFLSQNNKVVKLGDFGISTVLRNSLAVARTQCGTPYYFSPELCMNKPYNSKSDVWALGCLLYELMALRPAFDCKNMRQLMQAICQGGHQPIPRQYSRPLQQLVAQMLSQDPKKRPSAASILKKEFIQEQLQKICGKQAVPSAPAVFEKRVDRERRPPVGGLGGVAPPAPPAQKEPQPFRPEIKPVHVFEQEKRDQLRREHERRELDRKGRQAPPGPQPPAVPVVARPADAGAKAPMRQDPPRRPHDYRREAPDLRGPDPRREMPDMRREIPQRHDAARNPPRPEFFGRARQPAMPCAPPPNPGAAREFRQPDFRVERPREPNPLHGGAERPLDRPAERPAPPPQRLRPDRPAPVPQAAAPPPPPRVAKDERPAFGSPPKPRPQAQRPASPGRAEVQGRADRCRSASPHRGGSPRARGRCRSADPGRRPEAAAPAPHCAAEKEARDYHRMVQVIQQILTPKGKGRPEEPEGNADDVFGDDQDQVAYMLSFRLNGRPLELPDVSAGDPLPQRVAALRKYLEETLGRETFNKVYAILLDSSEDAADEAIRRQAYLVVGDRRRAFVELVSQLIFCEGVCDQKES